LVAGNQTASSKGKNQSTVAIIQKNQNLKQQKKAGKRPKKANKERRYHHVEI
jgi:hypothetical protein